MSGVIVGYGFVIAFVWSDTIVFVLDRALTANGVSASVSKVIGSVVVSCYALFCICVLVYALSVLIPHPHHR